MNPRGHGQSPLPDGTGEGTAISQLDEDMKGSPGGGWAASGAASDPRRDTDMF